MKTLIYKYENDIFVNNGGEKDIMKEKIKIPIKNVILKKENIIGLAKCIANQDDIRRICFNIRFMNDQEIESDDILIFENEKFNEFEIRSIHMSYLDKDYAKSIEIYIYNYQQYLGYSYVEISYESKENLDWLAITEKSIKDQISYCEQRNKYISLLQKDILLFVMILFLNIFTAFFIGRIIERLAGLNKEQFFICILSAFGFLESISICWRNVFYKAYPIIEIDIKDKNNSSKRARKMLKSILGTCIIPFILDIVFNLIERIIGIN